MTKQASSDKTGKNRFENSYVKPLASALDKISNYDTASYDSKEKTACISCINEHYNNFRNELQLPTASSWLTISEQQLNVIRKLDNCKNILFKCGYYNKKYAYKTYDIEFRYSHILTTVDKLKKSSKVFLSKAGQDDFYKIAFIYNESEYLTFELKKPINLIDIKFTSIREQSLEEIARERFSMLTTRTKAKELLATCDNRYYPDGVLGFMNVLLN